jgi:serine phosphatase RsbU (regulator of sigma subunit)
MAVEERGGGRGVADVTSDGASHAANVFREAAARMAEDPSADDALQGLVAGLAAAVQADEAAVRLLDRESGDLVTRYVWAPSPSHAAELIATRIPADQAVLEGTGRDERGRQALRRPIVYRGERIGSLELVRSEAGFGDAAEVVAELGAIQLGLALGAEGGPPGSNGLRSRGVALHLAGDALAAGSEEGDRADRIARLAAEAGGARASLLWRVADAGLELVAKYRWSDPPAVLRGAAKRGLEAAGPVVIERDLEGLEAAVLATIRLGEPPLGALQLVFEPDAAPHPDELARFGAFGARAALALRAGEAAAQATSELARTRALITVVGQAVAQLSLAHTLDTAVERIGELLGINRVAVYLRERGRLRAAAASGLSGPHARVADALLELALGPYRGRESVLIQEAGHERALARVRAAVSEVGIEAALAVPLVAYERVIGLLAVYPAPGRRLDQGEIALVIALAPQLAVAVENARLHEEATQLGEELEGALRSEREIARHDRALYEISRSFAESLSLDTTLDALTATVVDTLDVDVAAIRMAGPRGERLETRSIAVAQDHLLEGVEALLSRPQPVDIAPVRRLLQREPLVLDAESASDLPGHEFLVPFFEKGATAVILPVEAPREVVATMTLLSVDPARPITPATVKVALSIARHAALAIENARLYEQQKGFADTMQRALLARTEPELPDLDLAAVYESSARVDVGGDIYDFVTLPDGRLAVVLGDVTGHGIEAAADMAMAKFVFRSLSREHTRPGDFLAAANQIALEELPPGKFITMLSVTVDPATGEATCASAGHPAPRVLHANGAVAELAVRGLPLGVEEGETYEESTTALQPGTALVLHTDGVVEARRGREAYGVERLDRVLAEHAGSDAKTLAGEILAQVRAFSRRELSDDCAVVVIRRRPP